MTHYLIIDDDLAFCQVLQRGLIKRGRNAHFVQTAQDAIDYLTLPENNTVERVILDLKLAETTGLQLLPTLLAINPHLQVIVLTGFASVATTVEAIKRGAINYLCKPATVDEILAAFEEQEGAEREIVASKLPSVDKVEWEYIQRQLQAHNGNIAATARALGMHRRTLQRKLQKRPTGKP